MNPTSVKDAKPKRRHAWGTGGLAMALLLAGCSKFFDLAEPPPGHGVVYDHWFEDIDGLDYELIAVDGRAPERERLPFGVDMNPGAVVVIGEHMFKVGELPHRRLPSSIMHPAKFRAVVEGGRRYFIGTEHGLPVLVEWRKASRLPVLKEGAAH